MVYYEDDRHRLRQGLTNEQYHYILALECIAVAAFEVWHSTPSKDPSDDLSLNNLYDALQQVDFMEGDEIRGREE